MPVIALDREVETEHDAGMARMVTTLLSVDRFLLLLIATVAAASLVPARGPAAEWAGALADIAIALLFFLHGAKLSRGAIVQGMGNWRLHALTLASTYVLFPAIGLALVWLVRGWFNPLLLSGLLYLTLLPSTVQSSIAFTAMAGGNVAAAVCSASLSNLGGIVVTPVLVGMTLHVGGTAALSSSHAFWAIALQLLLPFLAGHVLRPLIGAFIDRNRQVLVPVDRGSILLVVYTAFSAAVVNGIWNKVDAVDLLLLLVLSSVMLAVVMAVNAGLARVLGLPREDAIVLLFCGSKKSLVSGVPMAGALFPAAQVGLVVLPLMLFHQVQLFVCAALAGYFRRQGEAAAIVPTALPADAQDVAAAAAARGFVVPDACMAGVIANLALLGTHAATMRERPADGIR